MKFILYKQQLPSEYWNGIKPLPDEINVTSFHSQMSEFELLNIICSLHGFVTAFDLLTGSNPDTEKDKDLISILTAFQNYIHPKMPLSHYSNQELRAKSITYPPKNPIQLPPP
jgi:hypothetical protein